MTPFTIGADPEAFAVNKDGVPISLVGKIGGSKKAPRPVISTGFALQEDNVAIEFNIPPAASSKEFVDNMCEILRFAEHELKKMDLTMLIRPAVNFGSDQLDTDQAKTFGCDPDLNAWTFEPNPKPECDDPSLRTGSGNIHLGTKLNAFKVIRAMDLFVGCPSIRLDRDVTRRKLYGKAGAMRFTPWGVEYRVLSNFWLASPDLMEWVYARTERAMEFVENNTDKLSNFLAKEGPSIQHCINHADQRILDDLDAFYAIV